MFITAFTISRHLSISWASSIQSIPPHPTSWRSTLILISHLRLGLESGLFLEGFPTKTVSTLLLSHTRYMPRPSEQYLLTLQHTNKIINTPGHTLPMTRLSFVLCCWADLMTRKLGVMTADRKGANPVSEISSLFLDAATLNEVFPCFFLGCKANSRV